MHPAIRAIPTFGILVRVLPRPGGVYKPSVAKWSSESDGKDGLDR
jgi:hypothetical protein